MGFPGIGLHKTDRAAGAGPARKLINHTQVRDLARSAADIRGKPMPLADVHASDDIYKTYGD
jgi:hypothetical protein